MKTIARTISGVTVAASCSEEAARQAEWFLNQVEEMTRRGLVLRDGAAIDFGWVELTLRKEADALVVCQPDFRAPLPLPLTTDITHALQVQGEQLSVARTVGVRPVFAKHRQVVLVAEAAWTAKRVMLSRFRAITAEDSGWTALAKDVQGPTRQVKLYELLEKKRGWLQALALPPGYVVELNNDAIAAVGKPAPSAHHH